MKGSQMLLPISHAWKETITKNTIASRSVCAMKETESPSRLVIKNNTKKLKRTHTYIHTNTKTEKHMMKDKKIVKA